jgi:hypothetical protein
MYIIKFNFNYFAIETLKLFLAIKPIVHIEKLTYHQGDERTFQWWHAHKDQTWLLRNQLLIKKYVQIN